MVLSGGDPSLRGVYIAVTVDPLKCSGNPVVVLVLGMIFILGSSTSIAAIPYQLPVSPSCHWHTTNATA